MAKFLWKGLRNNQLASDFITAPNIEKAKQSLQDMMIIVTEIEPVEDPNAKKKKARKKPKVKYNPKKIKNKHLMMFTKKFATMVEAGLPMMKTLQMLEEQEENPWLALVIHMIFTDVESGTTLSDAFARHPEVFNSIYINLVRAGETSGKLTFFMHRLTMQLEKAEKIRSKVKSALMYPVIMITVAVGVILIMLIKVVPVFQNMFASMGHDLPAITQTIVDMSEFLRDPSRGGVMIGVIVFSIWGFKQLLKKNAKVRWKFDKLMLKMPLAKDIIMKSTLAKIAMIEGNLSAAGVSVIESLSIIKDSVTNVIYIEAISEIQEGVAEGKPLSTQYERFDELFPPTFSQLLAVGEETGNMDDMFASVAKFYEEEFDIVVDRLTELLEPIMIVTMGGLIGFLIVAMYMPVFQVGQAVGGG